MAIVRPYEPPPDYPLDDPRPSTYRNPRPPTVTYRTPRLYESPSAPAVNNMIRTRQFPEIAGVSSPQDRDRPPSLRSFARFSDHNQLRNQPRQYSASSAASFHDTPFCPSRLNPTLRTQSRADSERPSSRISVPSSVSNRVSFPSFPSSTPSVHSARHSIYTSSDPTITTYTSPGGGGAPPPSREAAPPSLLLRSAVRKEEEQKEESNRSPLRKSCPDLKNGTIIQLRDEERRKRRGRKREEREWRGKEIGKWSLDDVILWLQEMGEEESASLLIGYEINGGNVVEWDEEALASLGIEDGSSRRKILAERDKILKRRKERTSLFDIIQRAAGDQVVVVQTPLTVRDLIVARNSSGVLAITRVSGSNLPLEQEDCLLEINSIPGEQFTSPLMLTKLISESGGRPIRFVVLRRARLCVHPEEEITRDSSSGVSSSSPVHHSNEKLT